MAQFANAQHNEAHDRQWALAEAQNVNKEVCRLLCGVSIHLIKGVDHVENGQRALRTIVGIWEHLHESIKDFGIYYT